MARRRCTDVPVRPTECLDVPSLSLDEFPPLLPPFAAALQAHMAAWRLAGQPRTARRLSVSPHWPLPTPAERWWFRLVALQTSALQGGQGRVLGMGQSTAQPGMHLRWPALRAALRALGDAPARSLTALAPRLGVTAADAAPVVPPRAEAPPPVVAVPAVAPASPLVPTPGRPGASSAPKPLRPRRSVRAASNTTTRAPTAGA